VDELTFLILGQRRADFSERLGRLNTVQVHFNHLHHTVERHYSNYLSQAMAITANGIPAEAATAPQSLPKHEDDALPTKPTTSTAKESQLLHRSFNITPTSVASTSGLTLTLTDGTQILDACGGAAVSCLGYDATYIAEVTSAITTQLTLCPWVHSMIYTTPIAEELATLLLSSPTDATQPNAHGLRKAYIINSGSEAMDAAMKFARQYWYERGQRQKVHFVSRRQSYHGNTIGALSVSEFAARKEKYADENVLQVPNVSWVTPAYAYQYAAEGEGEEAFAQRLVREVEEEFLRVGPERVVAFVAETVVGACSGATPAPRGYFAGVRRLCDQYDILMISDEVMCGMGRTGSVFAFEQEGFAPDLMTMGKCLGAGFQPIAAVLLHEKVVNGLKLNAGAVAHGHTYQAHPVGCAAALAVQKILRRDGLIERCREMGFVLEKLLKDELGEKKYVGDIRGRGLFWGVEFVKDRSTRESFPPQMAFGPKFQARVFEKGIAVYPGSGTVDGYRGDHAIVSPAYTVKEEELRTIVRVMKEAYEEMEHEIDSAHSGQ
jgi:adenosylmethionine-8-amino-7-oxononanoate aminotransferase